MKNSWLIGSLIVIGSFAVACSSLSVSKFTCDDTDFLWEIQQLNRKEKREDHRQPSILSIHETRQVSRTETRLSCRGEATLSGFLNETFAVSYEAEERDDGTYIGYKIDERYKTVLDELLRQMEATPPSDPRLGVSANDMRHTPEPIPISPSGPTATPRPKYTPTPEHRRDGLSRNQPMPVGMPMDFGSGISVTVESVTENANQIIKRHDALTAPPPREHQFLLVTLEVANVGDEPIDIYMVNELSLVGNSNVSYDGGLSDECWTFPNELDTSRTLFPTGSLSGNICFTVKSSDVDDLVMYYESTSFLGDDEFVYWTLR